MQYVLGYNESLCPTGEFPVWGHGRTLAGCRGLATEALAGGAAGDRGHGRDGASSLAPRTTVRVSRTPGGTPAADQARPTQYCLHQVRCSINQY